MGTRCKFYAGKSGGNNYGFKCKLYHNGECKVWSDGKRIIHPISDYKNPVQHEKEGRDKYVAEKCLGDCTGCSLYRTFLSKGSMCE